MRRTLWSMAFAGLTLGALGVVGGTAIGGHAGSTIIGSGLLIGIAALYLLAGLAIRDRAARSRTVHGGEMPVADRLAGRRVF
jgi:hypothetical protein